MFHLMNKLKDFLLILCFVYGKFRKLRFNSSEKDEFQATFMISKIFKNLTENLTKSLKP